MTNPSPPGQPWQIPDPTGTNMPAGGQVTPAGTTGAKPRRRVSPKLIVFVLLVAAVVWFIAVNRHDAKINLWVHTFNVPVWLVLLGTFIAGMLVDGLIRYRRRKPKS